MARLTMSVCVCVRARAPRHPNRNRLHGAGAKAPTRPETPKISKQRTSNPKVAL